MDHAYTTFIASLFRLLEKSNLWPIPLPPKHFLTHQIDGYVLVPELEKKWPWLVLYPIYSWDKCQRRIHVTQVLSHNNLIKIQPK
jgi:hypothetical protein